MHIIDNRPNLTSEIMCGLVLQGSNCVITDFDSLEFSVNVDENGPEITVRENPRLFK